LHIGCGGNELPGWLNTELCPRGDQIFLDATGRFPFADHVFAFIYTEHMIEHVSLGDAAAMLAECFRVLATNGVIRIVTPDLRFLVTLLDAPPSTEVASYINYAIDAHKIDAPAADGVSVFNNFVRAWGHQYIHSRESLSGLLERAGFEDIQQRPLNSSPHPELTGLAMTERMPAGFVEMESFVLEARKSAARG
jgi:predicted SAM-dependent methyltransferase